MGKYVTINTEPMNTDEFKETVRQLIGIVTAFVKDDGVTDHDA